MPLAPQARYRFQEFELDCARHELRRGDSAVKLENLRFNLLVLVVESKGDLVTRERIVERLWGAEHRCQEALADLASVGPTLQDWQPAFAARGQTLGVCGHSTEAKSILDRFQKLGERVGLIN